MAVFKMNVNGGNTMSEQEKMVAYIERTKMKNTDRYCLVLSDIQVMYEMVKSGNSFGAFELAFEYGRAKGYRMARKELRRG